MKKPKGLFFCRFPPPYTGETIGSRVIVELLSEDIEIETINATEARETSRSGGILRLGAVVRDLLRALKILVRVYSSKPDIFYFVPSSSFLGNTRDRLIVALIRPFVNKIVAHVRSGNFDSVLNEMADNKLDSFVDRVDKFIFLSKTLSERCYKCVPTEKVAIIYNSIDSDVLVDENEVRVKLRSEETSKFVILYASNMYPSKGYMDLAEALCQLNITKEWEAIYAGGWPSDADKASFMIFLEENALQDRVKVLGPVSSRQEMKKLYLLADAFVLPTYYPVEAQPRSIIEALNAATPIVTTEHASIPEYINNNVDGIFVSPKKPDQIARALERLSKNDIWQPMSKEARLNFKRNFSNEAVRKKLLSVIL